jgi:DNA helicase-2/ATP-dependent DNA helicase PcrA
MRFIADLHIHSHYSISTSPQLTPEHLEAWARVKGIGVIGSGDFTHPGWLAELKEKLERAEEGLFRLKDGHRLDPVAAAVPVGSCGDGHPGQVRFLLSAEISNIYRWGERVRKVHNLILAPSFEAAEAIQARLSRFANISSDGRPILGLDSRDLLEIVLECSPQCFFVPAHIWTPWFSALGAKSGFPGIEECYRDLSGHIRAVETGLSSDPPMNWLCSRLDKYTLISNSDAHSPEKLGREANLLETELSYPAIIAALSGGQSPSREPGFLGTLEFFPQEGKYHYDGHRKCGICWDPLETLRQHGICPVCGRPVTVGVLNRVAQLADRERVPDPHGRRRFYSLIPLKEIFSEITGVGAGSKQVARLYAAAVKAAGSEFALLLDMPEEEIRRGGREVLAEGIRRMRGGQVRVEPGFDGQFGRVRLFSDGEANRLAPQELLFPERHLSLSGSPEQAPLVSFDVAAYRRSAPVAAPAAAPAPEQTPRRILEPSAFPTMNERQMQAVTHGPGPLLILAGPGTGKTRTLTARITYLVQEQRVEPEKILAVTFTNKAAEEMKNRLQRLLDPGQSARIHLSTFHALGLSILKTEAKHLGRDEGFALIDEEEQLGLIRRLPGVDGGLASSIREEISGMKRSLSSPDSIGDAEQRERFELYEQILQENNLFDLDDLIHKVVWLFTTRTGVLGEYQERFQWILVDEYQDINRAQYRLIRQLARSRLPNLFVIGDPNQAIYGFRGADAGFINSFLRDYPQATVLDLSRSYRCSDTILQASSQVLAGGAVPALLKGIEEGVRIRILEIPSDRSEAEMIARTIERMMGGLRFFSMDSNISEGSTTEGIRSLADFAVLCRIGRQMKVLEEAFQNHSIPFQAVGETPFFKVEPVKSLVDLLRLCVKDSHALRTMVMNRGLIRDSQLEELRRLGGRNVAVMERLSAIQELVHLEVPEPQSRLLAELSGSFGTEVERFLEYVLLGSGADGYNRASERVSLMTLHAAKGLEFACVFIPGCEQGLLPYSLFESSAADPREERRLFYVGMTRARRYLYLSHANRRRLFGREYSLPRSGFLDPIEEHLLELRSAGPPRKLSTDSADSRQLDLF